MTISLSKDFKMHCAAGGAVSYTALLRVRNSQFAEVAGYTDYELDNDDFIQGSWVFQDDACDSYFRPGGACVGSFEFSVKNVGKKFAGLDFLNAIIYPYVWYSEIEEKTDSQGVTRSILTPKEKLEMPVYYISEWDSTVGEVIKFKALDSLSLLQTPVKAYKTNKGTLSLTTFLDDFKSSVSMVTEEKVGFDDPISSTEVLERIGSYGYFYPLKGLYISSRNSLYKLSNEVSAITASSGRTDFQSLTDTFEFITTKDYSDTTFLEILGNLAELTGCFVKLASRHQVGDGIQKIYLKELFPSEYGKATDSTVDFYWGGEFLYKK